MALTTTTLASAVAVNDNTITVTSGTGFAAGSVLRIDQEMLRVTQSYASGTGITVLRGQDGTATAAHKAGANVTVELNGDLPGPAPQTFTQFPTQRAVLVTSISVTGAIPIPVAGTDSRVILNGTTIIAATLANPTKDMDGDKLTIVGNGKAAHTVTYTAGLGNVGATADVLTFKADQAQGIELIAAGGFWVAMTQVAGAATVAGAGIA